MARRKLSAKNEERKTLVVRLSLTNELESILRIEAVLENQTISGYISSLLERSLREKHAVIDLLQHIDK